MLGPPDYGPAFPFYTFLDFIAVSVVQPVY